MRNTKWKVSLMGLVAAAACLLSGCGSAAAEQNKTTKPVDAAGVDTSEMVFVGWNTDKDGKGTWYQPGDTAPNNKDLDLYAQWAQKYYDFAYTGSVQKFTAPTDGTYKLEAWGASGPDYSIAASICTGTDGGHGGYTSGEINLKKSETIYVYVGSGTADGIDIWHGLFNGGGSGEMKGGGATDFRLVSGNWDNFDSLKSRIMVAGGGGGGFFISGEGLTPSSHSRGDAGGLNGIDAKSVFGDPYNSDDYAGHGASQTAGGAGGANHGAESTSLSGNGSFGKGGGTTMSSGGGGGYYGGGHGFHPGSSWSGGGGGSSFISGYPGCDAIAENSTATNIIHTGQSVHYSGKKFFNSKMVAGNETMTSPSGTDEKGHVGSGYARITYIGN